MRDEFISKFSGKEIDDAIDLILNGEIPKIMIDNVLSSESKNPVQNRVITNKINELEESINDVYTKTETDNLLSAKADSDDVYTKTETDNLLSAKADSDDVYTKTETDNLLSSKADKNGWVNGDVTAIVSGVMNNTNDFKSLDMSSIIQDFDDNAEYVGDFVFRYGNYAGRPTFKTDIYDGSLTMIFADSTNNSSWPAYIISMPFKKYIYYKNGVGTSGIYYIYLRGYRRTK